MKERLHGSDYRFIAICLVLGGAATWYSTRNFYRAFPEASIDFRVNRAEGRALAERFLAARRFSLQGYREAARFDFDNDAKTFLEREAGLERANRLMSTRVRLWRWSYRWFRPQQKEEFQANVSPAGDLTGFTHELPEEAARPTLAAGEARALAEDFLRTSAHRDPAALEFVEVNETARPHRTDRQFVWKERDFNLHDATYRVWVSVLGNEVGGFGEYLKVPEQWRRDYQTLRSKNGMAQNVDQAFMIFLMAGMLVTIVMRTRRQDVRWRRAALVGIAGMALALCASLNSFPLQEFGFRTTDSYGSFVFRELIDAVAGALAVGGFLFFIAAGAEPLYREAYGSQVSLGNLFRLRGLRTRRFFKGAILGVALAAIFIAYQTIFYLTAYRFGAWSPADVPYSDELNTAFPWLFVLFGGYFPAVFEEFTFRMFAIPFLRKLVRWLPLAVMLAGFIWGFGHSSYPQQPFFIRGVEVGIGGVALGIIMLRWGILPTLVWHYSVDAMYGAMLMLRSHSLYFKLSGAASAGIVILPIVVALAAYWLRGGFEPAEGLLNRDEPGPIEPPAAPAPAAESSTYRGLSSRARLAAVAIFAAGLATLLIHVERFGESPQYKLDAAQALPSADAFLRAQGVDPTTFRHVASTAAHWGGNDSLAGKYFLECLPVSRASRLFEQYRPVQHWAIRYFRPLDQEEVEIAVHPETGQVLGFDHTIPEDRPGADLSDDAARQIAMAFAASRGLDLASMDLKENSSETKKARRDHTLLWEARAGDPRNVDEARYRTEIEVDGDRVTLWRSFWKIPEAFARSRQRQNWMSIAAAAWRIVLAAAIAVWGLWLMIGNIRRGLVPWSTALRLAIPAALAAGIGGLLRLPQIYANYNTAVPLATFQASAYIGQAMVLVGAFLGFAFAAGFLTSFFPDCVAAFRPIGRRSTALDAVAATLAAAGFAMAASRLEALLDGRFHAQALFDLGAPVLLESLSPAVSALAGEAQGILGLSAAAALIVLLAGRMPKPWLLPAAMLAGLSLVSEEARSPAEFALSYGPILFACAGVLIFCRWFGRRNYLAYALVFWAGGLYTSLADLLGNPNPRFHAQGWMVLAVALASVAWLVLPAARQGALSGHASADL
jgi:membrane protease YdiL (CAAX protease family)